MSVGRGRLRRSVHALRYRLAQGYARMSLPRFRPHGPLPSGITSAMTAHPEMVAGTDRIITQLMAAFGDRIFCKIRRQRILCRASRDKESCSDCSLKWRTAPPPSSRTSSVLTPARRHHAGGSLLSAPATTTKTFTTTTTPSCRNELAFNWSSSANDINTVTQSFDCVTAIFAMLLHGKIRPKAFPRPVGQPEMMHKTSCASICAFSWCGAQA